MARARIVAVALLCGWVAFAEAGARRTVWMPPDASGKRPELPLFASAEGASACAETGGRAREPGSTAAPAAPGKAPQTVDAALRATCPGTVPLRHGTKVELATPPGACGDTLVAVRVLDGTYRGRLGCVRRSGLRVQ
jgi:hypothetical protein